MERFLAVLHDKRFARWFPAAVLVLLPFLLILPGLGSGWTLFGSDMIVGSFHIRGLVGQLLREGRLPVWDPHAMCGYPLLAAMQAGVLYPLTWPAAFLDPGPFWTATVYVHLLLAGTFAFAWLRRGLGIGPGGSLVGACIVLLSGYILTRVQAGHVSQICSYPWLVAVLWRAERMLAAPTPKRGALLALSVAMLILPGFPQFVFFAALLMAVRLAAFAWRTRREGLRTLGLTAASGIAGVLLAAPQLLPTLEALPEVQRVSSASYEFATQHSLPWAYLINLVAPDYFGNDAGSAYWGVSAIWEVTGYVGVAGLLLGLLALGGRHPQRYFWGAAALLAILLAPGVHSPVFKAFYTVVPGAGLFRAPGRYLAIFTLALAVLAALGFDRWRLEGPELRRPAGRLALVAGAGLAALVLALLLRPSADSWRRTVAAELSHPECLASESTRRDAQLPEKAAKQASTALGRSAVFFGIAAAALFAYSRGRLPAPGASAALGVLLVAELFLFGRGFFREYSSTRIGWPEGFATFVKSRPGHPQRLASPGQQNLRLIGKCQLAGLDHVGGYESMVLRRYCELMNVISGRPADKVRIATSLDGPHPILDMLGTRLWVVPEKTPTPPGWKALGQVGDGNGDSLVLEAPNAFPRAFVVPRAVVAPLRDDRLRRLVDPRIDLRRVVVLEEGASTPPTAGDEIPGAASVTSFAAGVYEISTQSASNGYLVLTEAWFPGWEASIDGVPVGILRANHFVQAVPLPAGRHTVSFRYHSTRLGAGLGISAAVAAAGLGAWFMLRRKSGAGPAPPGAGPAAPPAA